jgi:predicted Fe-Mo cluster-binding NifX family protein
VLLDASLDADTILKIREIIASEPALSELKWVTGRNAGRFRFVEAEITLRVSGLEKAEVVVRRIENRIREAVPHIDRVLIHAEPQARTHLRYAVPLQDVGGTVSEHLGEAPFFALVTVRLRDQEIEERQILVNPYLELEKAKGIRVAEWLVEHKVDVVLLKESLKGRGPAYAFGDAGVEVRQTGAATLAEVFK